MNDDIKKITITVVDGKGLVRSETRNFSTVGDMPPPGKIVFYGKVVDTDGYPVKGAFMIFDTAIQDYGPFSANTTTDRNGNYTMKKTMGLHQKITIQKAGYQNLVQEVTFEHYGGNRLDFTLSPQKTSAPGFSFTIAVFAIAIIFLITYNRKARRLL
jgi:hypothetical protein